MTTKEIHFKDFKQSPDWLLKLPIEDLKAIINCSFSNISASEYIEKYFSNPSVHDRKLRLFYSQKKLIGYCLLTFYYETIEGNQKECMGASAAFFPEFRHGNNTVQFSIQQGLIHWLKKPWRTLYYADTMLSPAMYRAIAKNTAVVYPALNVELPQKIAKLMQQLKIKLHNNQEPMSDSKYVVYVARKSNYQKQELDSFFYSDKKEIKYFCKVNPNFNQGYALICIIPINFTQWFKKLLKIKS